MMSCCKHRKLKKYSQEEGEEGEEEEQAEMKWTKVLLLNPYLGTNKTCVL